MEKLHPMIERKIIDEKQLDEAITKAANWVDENYQGKKPILIAILKGVIPFYGKLVTRIKTDIYFDFLVTTSFENNQNLRRPKIVTDVREDITDRDIIIVEDIIDTGWTLKKITEFLNLRKPRSIKILTLLDKHKAREADIQPDYACFKIDNVFVVGFGFDLDDALRNLPYIGTPKKEYY